MTLMIWAQGLMTSFCVCIAVPVIRGVTLTRSLSFSLSLALCLSLFLSLSPYLAGMIYSVLMRSLYEFI